MKVGYRSLSVGESQEFLPEPNHGEPTVKEVGFSDYQEFEVIAYIVLVIVVFLSFYFGGWAAGRMARIDGGITAIASAMRRLFAIVVFAAVGAFVGTEFNAFGQAGLPDWISQLDAEDITIGVGLATIGLILVMFFASLLGGRAGEVYHRDADRIAVAEQSATSPIT